MQVQIKLNHSDFKLVLHFDEKILFDEKIKTEPEIKKLFSNDELDELFSFAPYTTHADEIFNRVYGTT